MQVCNFFKKDTLAQVFSCVNFANFLRTPFYRKLPDDCFCTSSISPHKYHKLANFFKLWHRTNASGLITKFLKVPRIVNAINLRKFKNLISWFETEISSFSSFFSLFSLCSIFHLHIWLLVIIRATLRQKTMKNMK